MELTKANDDITKRAANPLVILKQSPLSFLLLLGNGQGQMLGFLLIKPGGRS